MHRSIAVIGGGAAATAILSEIVRHPTAYPLEVDWYAGSDGIGRGVAYDPSSDRLLLNARADTMEISASEPGGFLNYARERGTAAAGNEFLPRSLYGDYLQAHTARTLERARSAGNVRIRLLPLAAESLRPADAGVEIIAGDRRSRVDTAIFAIGALPSRALPGVAQSALDSGRYVVDPWRFIQDVRCRAPREVAVIGLGLTAADVIVELSGRWPNTHFTALSRHGLMPEAHPWYSSKPALSGELVAALLAKPNVRLWLHHIRTAIAAELDWRCVIDALRPHVPSLWKQLDERERGRFLRHGLWAWDRVRHRMPPYVRGLLMELEHAGRLRRLRGRIASVAARDERLDVLLRHSHGEHRSLSADYVIQCVGLNTDARSCMHGLIGQLLSQHIASADALGQGLRALSDGELLTEVEPLRGRLFAVGSLLRGTLWECTGIPEIRQQAQKIAQRIRSGPPN